MIVDPKSGVLFQNRAASFVLEANHPNVIEGGKKPMHTIIPSFVMKNNKPFFVIWCNGWTLPAYGTSTCIV